MMKNETGGAILNISSISGVVGMQGQSNYSASKAGMIGLTKSLAKEVASRKITVNALALGLIETDMSGQLNDEYQAKLLEMIPLGKTRQRDRRSRRNRRVFTVRLGAIYHRTGRCRRTADWQCRREW